MEPWFDAVTANIIGRMMIIVFGIWAVGVHIFKCVFCDRDNTKLLYCLYGITFFVGLVIIGIGLAAIILKQPGYISTLFLLFGSLVTVYQIAILWLFPGF
ncbi:MAG: hypothetical protein ACYTEU_07550 [Planctomycetota bacterium]|jgi:hypothetical protein